MTDEDIVPHFENEGYTVEKYMTARLHVVLKKERLLCAHPAEFTTHQLLKQLLFIRKKELPISLPSDNFFVIFLRICCLFADNNLTLPQIKEKMKNIATRHHHHLTVRNR